jgi:hypothetical protein
VLGFARRRGDGHALRAVAHRGRAEQRVDRAALAHVGVSHHADLQRRRQLVLVALALVLKVVLVLVLAERARVVLVAKAHVRAEPDLDHALVHVAPPAQLLAPRRARLLAPPLPQLLLALARRVAARAERGRRQRAVALREEVNELVARVDVASGAQRLGRVDLVRVAAAHGGGRGDRGGGRAQVLCLCGRGRRQGSQRSGCGRSTRRRAVRRPALRTRRDRVGTRGSCR